MEHITEEEKIMAKMLNELCEREGCASVAKPWDLEKTENGEEDWNAMTHGIFLTIARLRIEKRNIIASC